MKRRLDHAFVTAVPERLAPGVLYVSIPYSTMAHLCACGCGAEVFTPLSPTDWRFDYDGATVSVWPSVGSWNLPCRSHYVIDRGRVRVAGVWSDEQVEAGRVRDRRAKAARYGGTAPGKAEPSITAHEVKIVHADIDPIRPDDPVGQSRWTRLVSWMRRRGRR